MLNDFNILATTYRGLESQARKELCNLFEQIEDSSAVTGRTGISGLIAGKSIFDAFAVIHRFRRILQNRPYEFRFILRVIPIEKVVRTDIDEIKRTLDDLRLRIGNEETFRITVEKRHSIMSTRELIEAVAQNITQKVNLTNPDRIVLIQIIGKHTGLAVARPDDIISVLKEKAL